MIDIQDVSYSYGEDSAPLNLDHIQLHIQPRECVLLCGASGCGKTTLLKTVNGLIPYFDGGTLQGQTVVQGAVVAKTPLYELSQRVGSVFQNPKSQFFNIDSDSELAFGLENNGADPIYIKNRIKRVVDDLHIDHLLHRNVFSMSGGEKQSLAFASVYAMNPDVYVLDEPSANLDHEATERLREQILTIKNQGKTIIVSEHRLYYLADLIDRVVLIENGAIRCVLSRDEFLSNTEEQRHAWGLRTIQAQSCAVDVSPHTAGELEIKDLSLRYKDTPVFEHLNFAVSSGNVLGIVGRNGAGKSTLMRCIAGLVKESEGTILYKGKRLSRKARYKLCYMIMQDVNHQLFGDSVYNECLLSSGDKPNVELIENALQTYNLWDFRDYHPMALSGGQKQRLAIVTGLVAGKKVLMFDEPTSGLDYAHMCTVSATLRGLADAGHIVIVVTHDLELLNTACDQVLTL